MRSTKIMTFSIPPAFEIIIHKHAKKDHMTISEFLRDAVRKYIAIRELESLSKKGQKITKRKKLKSSLVDLWVNEERNK